MNWLQAHYLWLVAAHVIVVIFWMAGLFMLPRYLVYHQEALESPGGGAEAARWVDREGKLRHIILTPAMITVWLLGLMLAINAGLLAASILALSDEALSARLQAWRTAQTDNVATDPA